MKLSEPIKKCDVAIEKWEGTGICHGNGSTTHTYNTIIHSLIHSIHSQLAVSSAVSFAYFWFGFSFARVRNRFRYPLSMALPVVVDSEYLKEVDKARRDLRALIANRNCAPLMLRLAYVFLLYFFYFFSS